MKKRITIISLIFVFLFAAIVTKIVNERHVQHLGNVFSEMYDDRLLVESYIYQLSDLFYKKKIVLLSHERMIYDTQSKKEIQRQTSEIAEVARKYALTKLTEPERRIFEKFADNIIRIKITEAGLTSFKDAEIAKLEEICDLSLTHLKILSSIQVEEGNLLKENSKKVLSASYMAAQLEWSVFIIIPLLFMAILRRRKLFEDVFPQHQLN